MAPHIILIIITLLLNGQARAESYPEIWMGVGAERGGPYFLEASPMWLTDVSRAQAAKEAWVPLGLNLGQGPGATRYLEEMTGINVINQFGLYATAGRRWTDGDAANQGRIIVQWLFLFPYVEYLNWRGRSAQWTFGLSIRMPLLISCWLPNTCKEEK